MKITANRSDDEPFRITRLEHVRDIFVSEGIAGVVSAIHDHKGNLYVNWVERPATSQLLAAITAWASENEVTSNHYVNGVPLIWDAGGDNPFGGPPMP